MSDTKGKTKKGGKKGESKGSPVKPEELQKYLDALITDEHGAEVILDLERSLGAVADIAYSPERNECALRLLCPPEAAPFERVIHFRVKDALFRPDELKLFIRSTNLHIYQIKPAESSMALTMLAYFGLSRDEWKKLRAQLIEALKY